MGGVCRGVMVVPYLADGSAYAGGNIEVLAAVAPVTPTGARPELMHSRQ